MAREHPRKRPRSLAMESTMHLRCRQQPWALPSITRTTSRARLRQTTHIAVYEARWQQRAIDNFPRRPLTVSHSPPRRSYLGCQLLIRTTHCVYPVIAECRRILKGLHSYLTPYPKFRESRDLVQRATPAQKVNAINRPTTVTSVIVISTLCALNLSRAETSALCTEKC